METETTIKKRKVKAEPVIWWKDKLAAQELEIADLKGQLGSIKKAAEFGDGTGFPASAVRLVLNEQARWQNIPGYSRLANTCFGDNDTFWTAGRIEDRTDDGGKFHPALIVLTVERNYVAKQNAREEIRQLNSRIADAVFKGRQVSDKLKVATNADEIEALKKQSAVLVALVKDLMAQTERHNKTIERASEETWYFPMDVQGDISLATVSICL